jgi:hypothetical protein
VVRCGAVRVGSVRWLVRGSVRPDYFISFHRHRVAESDSERCMVYFIS